jgi:hypothetical protein
MVKHRILYQPGNMKNCCGKMNGNEQNICL